MYILDGVIEQILSQIFVPNILVVTTQPRNTASVMNTVDFMETAVGEQMVLILVTNSQRDIHRERIYAVSIFLDIRVHYSDMTINWDIMS